jgi:hypothetical protein
MLCRICLAAALALAEDRQNVTCAARNVSQITIHAVGDDYTKWEGYRDDATGETHIGLSYAKLCSSVKPGNKILLADGSISITVDEVRDGGSWRGGLHRGAASPPPLHDPLVSGLGVTVKANAPRVFLSGVVQAR